ncbi:transmembrane transporter [Malassezia pachydermatis]
MTVPGGAALDTPTGHLDGHGIFTVIVFAFVSIICIYPLHIPLPLSVSHWLRSQWRQLRQTCGWDSFPSSQSSSDPRKEDMELNSMGESTSSSPRTLDTTDRVFIPLTHVTAPIGGVLLLLATTSMDGKQVRNGIVGESGIFPYDILLLFLSLAYIAISLDATGLLRYLACHVCQRASFDGRVLYVMMYLFLWIAGVILGNDPVILSGTAFLVYVTRAASIDPPYAWLWSQFTAANIASAVLVSSNPTNLVIATGFDLSFVRYTAYMVLPSLVSACASLLALMLFFGLRWPPLKKGIGEISTSNDEGKMHDYIPKRIHQPDIQPRSLLIDPVGALFTSAVMIAVICLLVGTSALGDVHVYQIGVPGAALCLCRDIAADLFTYRKSTSSSSSAQHTTGSLQWIGRGTRLAWRIFPVTLSTLFRLPLDLLPFAFGMFILVQGLDHVGFVTIMAEGLGKVCQHGVSATVFFMAVLSIILCNFGGTNIGSTILLTKVMQNAAFLHLIPSEQKSLILKAGMYAVAFGSNLGALGGTFAASLAGLLWLGMLKHHAIHITRTQFALWCAVAIVPAIGAGLGVLLAEVLYFHMG